MKKIWKIAFFLLRRKGRISHVKVKKKQNTKILKKRRNSQVQILFYFYFLVTFGLCVGRDIKIGKKAVVDWHHGLHAYYMKFDRLVFWEIGNFTRSLKIEWEKSCNILHSRNHHLIQTTTHRTECFWLYVIRCLLMVFEKPCILRKCRSTVKVLLMYQKLTKYR